VQGVANIGSGTFGDKIIAKLLTFEFGILQIIYEIYYLYDKTQDDMNKKIRQLFYSYIIKDTAKFTGKSIDYIEAVAKDRLELYVGIIDKNEELDNMALQFVAYVIEES
jgi:hypothetical protein